MTPLNFDLPDESRETTVDAVAFEVALSSFDLSAFDRRPLTDWVATGLSESAVFDTLLNPTSAFVSVTLPVLPFTDWTSEVVTSSTQFSSTFAGSSASTNVFPMSVRIAMLPTTAGRFSIAASESTGTVELPMSGRADFGTFPTRSA